ncbi:glycosyltransferase family 2 protein [Stakelama marina]|uniref:Glycosyltransferase family 2 protein n=1 Tax=Stakelama marina TaxID=2826939 RepID=A0A8T4IA81_9SPHN|nr:glycosyltransferase family A protein [Stakelama marina]MBR0551042.1 glycosyltransferase family 2 protein [Stakelama marina]
MTTSPTVSVIMAAYNGAPLIAETLDSLHAQTMSDFEVVIVDDCSSDDTGALVRAYGDPRLRLIRAESNGGPVAARNRAFVEARGRYVAGLDHDDLCRPDRFARQVAFLNDHPDTVLVATGSLLLQDGKLLPSQRPRGVTPDLIDWMMLTRNPLVWSSVMFRAEAARQLDPFERPDRIYVEDYDLYHRLRAFGRFAELDEPLTYYRVHAGGLSKRFTDIMLEQAGALLRESHALLLGQADDDAITRIIRHVMAREPVTEPGVLLALFADIQRLRDAFVARNDLDATARRAVDEDVSQLWWRISRAAVRSGSMPLHRAMATRPATVQYGAAKSGDLFVSEMIGRMRALR